MGAALNTAGAAEIAAELACCACSSACGFLCKDQATRAKLRYCTLLLFATTMCFVMLVPGMRRNLDRVPNLCGKAVKKETCDLFFGFGAVYRVMLSMTCFYGAFAIFTIRITKVNSFRAKFNNGFWIIKILILLGITISTFFIPKKSEFFLIWMYTCLIGGFVFMLYQIMLVIDFGHSWSISWAERLETSNTKLWYLAMILATLLMFIVSMAAIASFYYLFAGSLALSKCKANMFYVTFIVIQCFLATIVSITPTVQQELEGAGLLQSSVVVLYASYLTWNTLSTEPDAVCNPLGKVILDYDTMSGIDGAALFGCLLTVALIIFACTVRTHTSHLGKYGLALSEGEEYAIATFMNEKNKRKIDNAGDNEISLDDFVGYNYSLFHVIMTLASLYVLMILTNWHSPDQKSNMKRLVKNWASVWVQMASSFICVLIYVWFLVTPLIRRLWGPLFGISPDDISHRGQGYGGQDSKGQTRKVQNLQAKGQNDIVPLLKGKNHNADLRKRIAESKENGAIMGNHKNTAFRSFTSVESLKSVLSTISKKSKRSRAKKENEPLRLKDIDNSNESMMTEISVGGNGLPTKRKNLRRFRSIESLKSGFSAISNATSEVTKKLKTRLQKRDKLDKLREANSKENDVIGVTRGDISRDHSESFHSKTDLSRRRTVTALNKDCSNAATDQKNTEIQNGEQHTSIDNKIQNNSRSGENNLDNKIKNNGNILEENERMLKHNEATLTHSSTFPLPSYKRKAQDPEVAREILKLQWKILRMQAKVVKIQEKIIRIQAENEAAKNNVQTLGDRVDPPVGQSSTVAGGVYSRRAEVTKDFHRKEHG